MGERRQGKARTNRKNLFLTKFCPVLHRPPPPKYFCKPAPFFLFWCFGHRFGPVASFLSSPYTFFRPSPVNISKMADDSQVRCPFLCSSFVASPAERGKNHPASQRTSKPHDKWPAHGTGSFCSPNAVNVAVMPRTIIQELVLDRLFQRSSLFGIR